MIRYRIFIVRSRADNSQLNLLNNDKKNSKKENLRSTGSKREAVESVLRKHEMR